METNNIYHAKSDYYFKNIRCPIAIHRVSASNSMQHAHDYTSHTHNHDFSELIILTDGNGRQIIDDELYEIEAGDIFLIQGDSSHNFLDRNQVSMINVQFDMTKLPLPFDWLRRIEGYNIIFELEPNARTIYTFKHRLKLNHVKLQQLINIINQLEELLIDVENTNNNVAEVEALSKLLELIIFISKAYNMPIEGQNSALIRLGKIISMLESTYAKSWNLDEMSKIAMTSPNNFLRLFKKATNMTPVEYLNNIRLTKSAEMLLNSENTISEIAIACGFNDSNYFARKFNEKYNISPSKYRK